MAPEQKLVRVTVPARRIKLKSSKSIYFILKWYNIDVAATSSSAAATNASSSGGVGLSGWGRRDIYFFFILNFTKSNYILGSSYSSLYSNELTSQ